MTVVLLHGLATSSASTWTEAGWVELLGELGHDAVAIDLPGHGGSPGLDDPAGYADLVGWVLDRLPEGPVDLVGFSLGARLALALAARHPDRVRRVVAAGVGATLLHPDPERSARIVAAVSGHPAPDDPTAAYFDRLATAGDVDRSALIALLTQPGAAVTAEDLAAITAPVLVVLGDRDDAGPLGPLVDAIPGARGVELRGIDHFATPKALGFLDAALDFLA